MANWTILKEAIANVINTNGNQEITGQSLQNILHIIVTSVGENATFVGVATLGTRPGVPDGPVFYLASEPGTYPNFSGIKISTSEIAFLKWNGYSWEKHSVDIKSVIEEITIPRLRGLSKDSDSRKDPFKLLGYPDNYENTDKGFENYSDFNDAIDNLLYNTDVTGHNYGYFRARVLWRDVEIKNILLSSSQINIIQIISGALKIDSTSKQIVADDYNYRILWRQHTVASGWSEWKDQIASEENRAKAAEAELLKRLNGISKDSDSRKDPFKFIGPNTDEGYASYDVFTDALDELLFDNSVVGYNSGYFRARVRWCEVEIRNIVRSNADQIIIQAVSGAIKIDDSGKLTSSDNDYKILYRKHSNNSWGDWKDVYQDKLVSGTNIKTINNQSILGSGNITISGSGGGEVSPELVEQVSANTNNIAQNTSDIEKLMKKNFPLTVSFSISPSGLQEYGTTVNTVTANWSIEGADVEVLGIELRLGSGSWIDVTGKTNHTFSNAGITKNTTVNFVAEISGEDVVNKSASINFAYAAYMGVVAADWAVSETNIKSLTKQSLSTSKSRNYTTSSALSLQKIVYAYAQSYGAISKVLDGNGFDVTESFEQKTTTVNGVAYYVYISKEATTTTTKVTVKFS